MTPQEADIIRSVFDRLQALGPAPRDAEAEGLVEARLRADPSAGLALVRALVVTDRAQAALAAENEELKRRLATAAPQPAQPQGGLFDGPWGRAPTAPMPQAVPQPMPMPPQGGSWGGGRIPDAGPWGGGQGQQGSGFWGSALRTGAGVAGGLFAFEALKGLFGGGAAHAAPMSGLFDQPSTVVNETVNVFQGDRDESGRDGGGFGGDTSSDRGGGAGLFDASDDGSSFDGGGFGGDDDGWA